MEKQYAFNMQAVVCWYPHFVSSSQSEPGKPHIYVPHSPSTTLSKLNEPKLSKEATVFNPKILLKANEICKISTSKIAIWACEKFVPSPFPTSV